MFRSIHDHHQVHKARVYHM